MVGVQHFSSGVRLYAAGIQSPIPVPISPPQLSDADLVIEARRSIPPAGDAFGELVRRYQRMVYALSMSLVRPSDVDDVVQDAFLRAFRNLDLLVDPAKFGIWLRRITFGVAIDHVRSDRARYGSGLGPFRADASNDAADDSIEPTAHDLSALQQLERNEVVDRVSAALDRLPARYRVPLTLYHIDGLSQAKVARALGVPEGTVRSLVARARRKLARLLANAPEVQDMADEMRSTRNAGDVLDDTPHETPRFLHILNGDSVRGTLEQSDVPGAFVAYAEILHEGPVPRENGSASWRESRARYLAARGYVSYAQALKTVSDWDAQVAAFGDYDEVVLWFEHDLFDQILLVRHLDWFSQRDLGRTALSLICIGEFPGVEPFHGLGQLDANQLASLLGTRQLVSPDQFALGQRAWRAFTSSDPNELDALSRGADAQVLPFLAGALQRFLEDYPVVGTGLPRTERQILEILSEGARSPVELFVLSQRREERVYMGDTTFWNHTRDLAGGRAPLVSLEVAPDDDSALPAGVVTITDTGRAVLSGRADWVRVNGFDRWLGGVHLSAALGGEVPWRYDPSSSRVVRTG